MVQHRDAASKSIGQTSLTKLENIFSGKEGQFNEQVRSALRYDRRNKDGYPCPIQLGALTDPCDNIERQQGWLLDFIKLAIKYNQPVRISTKGKIFQTKEYQKAISAAPHLFWITFSIITADDEIMAQIDRRAPVTSQRIKTMKVLSDLGVKTALRFRPILAGISDRTKKYPKAYKTLIEMAANAGAKAISYEVAFTAGIGSPDITKRWKILEEISGVPYRQVYSQFGKKQSCNRPSYLWTENIMHAIAEESKKNGLTVGVSDPVWKQLGETGCCCGMLPDDKVFGNWQTESATNQLLIAKNTGKELCADDVIPEWAKHILFTNMCNGGVGPTIVYKRKHYYWADALRSIWNDLKRERSPLNYFQGALEPVRKDKNGEVFYKYKGLVRRNPAKIPYWRV